MLHNASEQTSAIVIGNPIYKNGRYEIPFTAPKALQPFFRSSSFWLECSDAGEVPESIAVVPAVANLIPFAWVFDCTLEVARLDKAFYDAIPRIKKGYVDMLPKLDLKGGLEVDSIVRDTGNCEAKDSPLMLFSGGVDAWCTLVRHVNEKPHLVSIWGADIGCDNVEGWSIVNDHSKTVADSFGLSYSYVKSNLREMIDYRALDDYLDNRNTGYNWWHELQHGIGMLSLTVLLAFVVDAPRTYIASTFFSGDKGCYTCASDPTIDNKFEAGLMRGVHDGYELTRQDKIGTIVAYSSHADVPVNLRVCFHTQTGGNCCRCEKCGRTILGIYAAGGDPCNFGFSYTPVKLALLSFRMKHFYQMKIAHYRYIKEDALKHKKGIPVCFSWIFSDNLEYICDNGFKQGWDRFHKFGANLYHKMVGE